MHRLELGALAGNPGNPAYFTGAVTLKTAAEEMGSTKLIRVEFAACARTHWHRHSGVQVLVVVAGRCRYQQEGGPIEEAGVGEAIYIPPGEKHWHGATPEAPMVHLALNLDLETEWLEAVGDEVDRGG